MEYNQRKGKRPIIITAQNLSLPPIIWQDLMALNQSLFFPSFSVPFPSGWRSLSVICFCFGEDMEVPKNTAELLTSLFQQVMPPFICSISSLVFWSCELQHKSCVCGSNPNFVLCVHNKWFLILQDLFFHENMAFLLLFCFHIKRGKRKEEDIPFSLWWKP